MNTIQTQSEYEAREMREFRKQLADVEGAPLRDRKEAAKDWANAMHMEQHVSQRVGWLLDGNYGYGAMKAAQSVAKNTRMNRAAQLGIWIAALDWNCPAEFASKAWKALPVIQQEAINGAILAEVGEWMAKQGKE